MENVLATTQEAAESGWQALINEERLLSRIESLENQVAVYKSKAMMSGVPEELQEQIQEMLEDRTKAELAAKDSLKKAEDQIYEANMKVHDMERLLQTMDENNQALEFRNNELNKEIKRQSDDYDKLLQGYTEASKEIAGLKESLTSAKKAASTFSVTRIEPSSNSKKRDSVENIEGEILQYHVSITAICLASSALNNGTHPDKQRSFEKNNLPLCSSVFYQEAEVQTDSQILSPKHQLGLSSQDHVSGNRSTRRNLTTSNDEAQILLISLFPLLFVIGLLTIWPLNLLMRGGAADECPKTEPTPTTDNELVENVDKLKKAE